MKKSKIEEIITCLEEATDLMDDVRNGIYKPDSFTTQPWKIALKGIKN